MKMVFLPVTVLLTSIASNVVCAQEEETWGYKLDDPHLPSPLQWKDHFPTCGQNKQSPVDIQSAATKQQNQPMPLTFSGTCESFSMTQEDAAFKGVNQNGNCKVNVAEKAYKFLQFHSHIPSEHTIDGRYMDAEVHFVHQLDGGKDRLVIGMFVQIAESDNKWVQQAWHDGEDVNDHGGVAQNVTISGSYSSVLSGLAQAGSVFNYPGSLTTPPCDENVDWWVVKTPVQLTRQAFNSFAEHMKKLKSVDNGHNNRPIQALNGRDVMQYTNQGPVPANKQDRC